MAALDQEGSFSIVSACLRSRPVRIERNISVCLDQSVHIYACQSVVLVVLVIVWFTFVPSFLSKAVF